MNVNLTFPVQFLLLCLNTFRPINFDSSGYRRGSENCTADVLTFHDGNSPGSRTIDTFCGDQTPATGFEDVRRLLDLSTASTGHQMYVVYNRNPLSQHRSKFNLTFTTRDNNNVPEFNEETFVPQMVPVFNYNTAEDFVQVELEYSFEADPFYYPYGYTTYNKTDSLQLYVVIREFILTDSILASDFEYSCTYESDGSPASVLLTVPAEYDSNWSPWNWPWVPVRSYDLLNWKGTEGVIIYNISGAKGTLLTLARIRQKRNQVRSSPRDLKHTWVPSPGTSVLKYSLEQEISHSDPRRPARTKEKRADECDGPQEGEGWGLQVREEITVRCKIGLGTLTTKILVTACPIGRFGRFCAERCQCYNGAACHSFNGACRCAPGWTGRNCITDHPEMHICPSARELKDLRIGQELQLTCTAYKLDVTDIKWFFESGISVDQLNVSNSKNSSVLYINSLAPEHEGHVTCEGLTTSGDTYHDMVHIQIVCEENYWGPLCDRVCNCTQQETCERLQGCVCYGDGCPNPPGSQAVLLATSLSAGALILLLLGAIFLLYRHNNRLRVGNIDDPEVFQLEQDLKALMPPAAGSSSGSIDMELLKEREIDRSRLQGGQLLGEGAFGHVVKATLTQLEDDDAVVAVKKLKDDDDSPARQALLRETCIMLLCDNHDNIIRLKGICFRDGPLQLVLEYAEHGSLLHLLWTLRAESKLNRTVLVNKRHIFENMMVEVCCGLEHLATMRLVHRDIAARNILICGKGTAKIADFGLARDMYAMGYHRQDRGRSRDMYAVGYHRQDGVGHVRCGVPSAGQGRSRDMYAVGYHRQDRVRSRDMYAVGYHRQDRVGPGHVRCGVPSAGQGRSRDMYAVGYHRQDRGNDLLPLKWMAPEGLKNEARFTHKSDVWSFGVLLWEVAQLGRTPYPGMEGADRIFDALQNHFRLPRPQLCTEERYQLMLKCWKFNEKTRPDATTVRKLLEADPNGFLYFNAPVAAIEAPITPLESISLLRLLTLTAALPKTRRRSSRASATQTPPVDDTPSAPRPSSSTLSTGMGTNPDALPLIPPAPPTSTTLDGRFFRTPPTQPAQAGPSRLSTPPENTDSIMAVLFWMEQKQTAVDQRLEALQSEVRACRQTPSTKERTCMGPRREQEKLHLQHRPAGPAHHTTVLTSPHDKDAIINKAIVQKSLFTRIHGMAPTMLFGVADAKWVKCDKARMP
ncbi:hypothetical protein Bbelb_070650 [Branchiostoma belcheri]|nr:hypothetical protein Bbelb_070650 [Branchiostoma belcheri]